MCGGGKRVPGGPRLPGLCGGGVRRVRTGTTGTTSSDSIYVSYIWVPRVPREPGLCVFDSKLLLSVLVCVCVATGVEERFMGTTGTKYNSSLGVFVMGTTGTNYTSSVWVFL